MEKTTIAIIGLGGVGGYFGCKLAQTYVRHQLIKVAFVARSQTYKIVAEKGLTLLSPEHVQPICRPEVLAEDIKSLTDADICIICVKEYDLNQVCEDLKDKITDQTILIPLMNGVDIYERIRSITGKGIVLPACVYVASHIRQKGVVEHKGKSGKLIIGKDPLYPEFMPTKLVDILRSASINITFYEDAFSHIWTKFLFIASFGLVTACYNKSIGEILQESALREQARTIMEEIYMIALKKGIALPDTIIDQTFDNAATFPFDTPTSLQLDVRAKKENNELELFGGTIIRYGKVYGVPVSTTEVVYQLIHRNILA